jgi:uncharacterized membrane protein YheB (UPF0754 family)
MDLIYNNLSSVIGIPLMAAFIGWVTTYLAIKMIFKPKRPINILGLKIQGVVPKRQKELAKSMGEMIQRDLLSHHDVTNILQSSDLTDDVLKFIEIQIGVMLTKFIAKNPMISMFLSGDKLKSIQDMLSEEIKGSIPGMMDTMINKVENKLDFAHIVESRVNSFDLTKLEEIVHKIAARELKAIEYLCGVLGFVVGIFQVAVILLTQ